MTFQQELSSWFSPSHSNVSPPPTIGSQAPTSTPSLDIRPGKATIITFLRHCGCPWAEKTFLAMRETAKSNPTVDFIAVSHSEASHTDEWRDSLPGGKGAEPGNLRVVVDEKSEIYAAWGLGTASWGQVVSPSRLWEVYRVGRDEGIKNRPTRSGSRWQQSGSFGVDGEGVVRWGRPNEVADEVMDFGKGVEKVKAGGGGAKL